MNLPVIFCVLSLMAFTSCADSSVNKSQVASDADQEQRADNDLSAAIALTYLTKNSERLGINNPRRDLKLLKITKDKYLTQHVKYAQLYKSIPVWGSEFIVHIKDDKVYRVDGGAKTIRGNLSVVPKLSSEMAEQSAFNMVSGKYDSQLMILAENNMATLAYLVQLSSALNRYMVFVDANNGEVIKTINAMPNTLN